MRHRWVICFLLFAGATISYIDRQALAVLKPSLQLTGSYEILFVVPALAYIVALGVIPLLAPRLAPVLAPEGGLV